MWYDIPGRVEEWHIPIANTDRRTTERSTSDSLGDVSWIQKAALQLYGSRKELQATVLQATNAGARRPGYVYEAMGCKEVVMIVLCGVFVGGLDLTLEPNTAGDDVVRATVAKVLSASRNEQRIFGNRINYWLLRRIAYVETRDGLNTSDQNYYGGIWRVDEEVFSNIRTNSTIQSYRDAVESVFDIRWNIMSWTELRKPLYSALATALNLVAEKDDNCLSSITLEQALCWLMRHRRISEPAVGNQAAIERYKAAVAALASGE